MAKKEKPSLFHIEQNRAALDSILMEIGGDVTDGEIGAIIDEWLAENEAQTVEKLDGYAAYIRQLEADEAAKRVLAAQYQDEARLLARKQAVLKARVMDFMRERGETKIVAQAHTISIQNNGSDPPLVLGEYDIDLLPPKFVLIEKKLNNEAVREVLESGTPLDFAKIGERGSHIRIR